MIYRSTSCRWFLLRWPLVLLVALCLLVPLSGSARADDFTTGFGDEKPGDVIPGSTALDTVEQLFTDRVSNLLQNDFGGFNSLSQITLPSDSPGMAPDIDMGTTPTFGHMHLDMNMIPSEFWTGLQIVILSLSGWTAFKILVRA